MDTAAQASRRFTPDGLVVLLLPCALLAISAWATFRCYALSPSTSAAASLLLGGAAALAQRRWAPAHLRCLTLGRWLRVGWLLLALVVIAQTCRLSAFMANPERRHSLLPSSDFLARHSCATAYYEAARLLRDGQPPEIIYKPRYGVPGKGPRSLGAFNLDAYEYTPAFLLVPRLLLPVTGEYPRFRALWNLVMVFSVLAGLALVAAWLPPESGRRAALAAPLALVGVPTISGLQMGNVHMAMIALAVVAMIAFERARLALGGAMLGYAILSKLSPGILVLYLAGRRQWRAVAWALAGCAMWLALSLVVFGVEPWRAFLFDHMARLDSGLAFSQLQQRGPALANMSLPGMLFKLKMLGLTAAVSSWQVRGLGWLFTAVVVGLALIAARRPLDDRLQRVSLWLALLTLGALRSTFVPPSYGLFPAIWLATLLVSASDHRHVTVAVVCLACMPFLGTPGAFFPTNVGLALAVVAQLMSLLLAVMALRLARSRTT